MPGSARRSRDVPVSVGTQASAEGRSKGEVQSVKRTAGVLLGCAAVAAAAAGFVDPAAAIEGIEGEPNLLSDFYVREKPSSAAPAQTVVPALQRARGDRTPLLGRFPRCWAVSGAQLNHGIMLTTFR